jgi:hypothetical protein
LPNLPHASAPPAFRTQGNPAPTDLKAINEEESQCEPLFFHPASEKAASKIPHASPKRDLNFGDERAKANAKQ